jgi:hypothetical protein
VRDKIKPVFMEKFVKRNKTLIKKRNHEKTALLKPPVKFVSVNMSVRSVEREESHGVLEESVV